uniref:Uncharacterized protein n=1 Tax=Arundo donax TaxID=35708 RepID=A0A0A9ELP4_ARUDO
MASNMHSYCVSFAVTTEAPCINQTITTPLDTGH